MCFFLVFSSCFLFSYDEITKSPVIWVHPLMVFVTLFESLGEVGKLKAQPSRAYMRCSLGLKGLLTSSVVKLYFFLVGFPTQKD